MADESFQAYYLKTDEEAVRFWSKWISEHPEKIDEIYNAEQMLATFNLRLTDDDLHAAFARFDDFIAEEQVAEEFYQREKQSFFTLKKALAFCAIVISCSAVGMYLMRSRVEQPISYATYHNGFGKTAQLTLADGSVVTLNSNSTLKYPKSFSSSNRAVTLDGEAFFEIVKDKAHPFSVHAKGTTTTVLGTKFNISAYPNDNTVKIALVEGKVMAEAEKATGKLILKPSEVAIWSTSTHQFTKSVFDSGETLTWKSGAMVFKNASFDEIASRFKNVYGIELINRSSNTKWSFSGYFNKTDYKSVIKSICFSKQLNYTLKNNTIILTP